MSFARIESLNGKWRQTEVLVSRPYLYASNTGSAPTPLLGCETFHFPEYQLDEKHFQTDVPIWLKVDEGRKT